ncbi:MAG: hypothetical protein WCR69_02670 [Sulfuricurvum sp.]
MKTAYLAILLLLFSYAEAKPNLEPPIEEFVKLEKLAGRAGAFTTKESFPKDYFLIPKNLPFLVGLTLYDPNSSELGLSQKQIDAILKVRKNLMDRSTPIALKVKELELEIMNKMVFEKDKAKARDLYPLVDEVAKLRVELTHIHLECIESVRDTLTKEQFEELLDYGVVNMF